MYIAGSDQVFFYILVKDRFDFEPDFRYIYQEPKKKKKSKEKL